MTTLLLAVLLAAGGAGTDTTLSVAPGSRLEVENFTGSVRVSGWNRDALRIHATHGSHSSVAIRQRESVTRISSEGRMGVPGEIDYEISMPVGMALKVSGVNVDMTINGLESRLELESVQGDIAVRGGRDRVKVGSVQGSVSVQDARGRVEASSVNAAVKVADVEGDVEAETVNGSVEIERARSEHVEAGTVNGTVDFSGPLARNGSYHFSSHSGTVRVCVPEGTNAAVHVSMMGGEFSSDFPVTTHGASREKEFEFTLGSGSAELELESFQGGIVLCRQGRSLPSRPEPRPRPEPKPDHRDTEE